MRLSAPVNVGPFTPWFRARMTSEDRATVRRLQARGLWPSGFAASARGPFTARCAIDGAPAVGCGSTPAEALERLAAKVAA